MYSNNQKKSYYRFPSKNSITDFDSTMPYYFPTKKIFSDGDLDGGFMGIEYGYYHDTKDMDNYEHTTF